MDLTKDKIKAVKPGLTEYEYWPYWVFYAPFLPYWFFNSIKSGSFSYFCRVNPSIEFGGFLDYSKSAILDRVEDKYKPKTLLLKTKAGLKELPKFPFVVKPDKSERGKNVEIIKSESDWENYPIERDLIIQEYVDYPLEFGIFFVRTQAGSQGKILSVTGKEFLVYKPNGNSTLKKFVLNNPRAYKRRKYLENKFGEIWDTNQNDEREILLEPVGNHNRGTRFFDASELISDELTETVSRVTANIKGFYYGRLDVKVQSEDDLKNGNFKIIEINGANSEPTHIYDEKFSLAGAYKEVKRHLDIQYKIARRNPKTYSSYAFYKAVLNRIF